MYNFSVFILKSLLASTGGVAMALSVFSIIKVVDVWAKNEIPSITNLMMIASLFMSVIFLSVICMCLKFYLDISIDNRELAIKKKNKKIIRNDDVTV